MALSLKSVEASRGSRWVGDAWRVFAKKPLGFTALFAVFLFSALLVSLVPVLGALVQMAALPLLSLGFMVAAQAAMLDGQPHPRHYVEPLRTDAKRRRALLILCVLYGVAVMVILIVANAASDGAWARLQELMPKGDAAQAEINAILSEPGVATGFLLAVVLGAALSVPFWHAPALVHWGGQGVGQALFSSTLAVWRNKGAFFVYLMTWVGLAMAFGVLLALVLGLLGLPQMAGVIGLPGGLVFSAVFYISVLFSFNDSFGGSAVPPLDDAPTAPDPG
jgi:hypothetical protein